MSLRDNPEYRIERGWRCGNYTEVVLDGWCAVSRGRNLDLERLISCNPKLLFTTRSLGASLPGASSNEHTQHVTGSGYSRLFIDGTICDRGSCNNDRGI